jgi:hypothetical protein
MHGQLNEANFSSFSGKRRKSVVPLRGKTSVNLFSGGFARPIVLSGKDAMSPSRESQSWFIIGKAPRPIALPSGKEAKNFVLLAVKQMFTLIMGVEFGGVPPQKAKWSREGHFSLPNVSCNSNLGEADLVFLSTCP